MGYVPTLLIRQIQTELTSSSAWHVIDGGSGQIQGNSILVPFSRGAWRAEVAAPPVPLEERDTLAVWVRFA